jgi:hypothetical protein
MTVDEKGGVFFERVPLLQTEPAQGECAGDAQTGRKYMKPGRFVQPE